MHAIRRGLRSFGLVAVLGAFAWCRPAGPTLLAQGVTTTAIRGSVRTVDGVSVDGAQVRVVNTATGFAVETVVRKGRFLVSGLEVGGPYTVAVRRLGFLLQQRGSLFLTLGEPLELLLILQPAAIPLETLRIIRSSTSLAHTHGGTATTLTDSLLHRLPTLNRDLYDFVRLVPQISTKVGLPAGGLSGGGVGFRFNSFLINGAPERFVSGNSSLALLGGKSVPLDAVKEYQVLLAPYDVRYGDFAGALVNTVTRSGTNELHGSVFAYARNDRLARRGELAPSVPYERLQYGFSLGGPIVRDRLHFYVAPELQRLTSPAAGPYLGQPPAARPAVPVSAADLARFDAIMSGHGLEAGSAGQVQTGTPLTNVFARLDIAIPEWNSRAILWGNYIRNAITSFSRAAWRDTFSLSSYQLTPRFESRMTALQLHTALRRAGGGHNELLVSYRPDGGPWLSPVKQPVVQVAVPHTSGGLITLNSGTHPSAHGTFDRSWTIYVRENLTLPFGVAHVVTLGMEAERFRLDRGGLVGSYGMWTFSNLDSLELGAPERYEIPKDFGSADVPISGTQYAAYAGDQWRVGERLQITVGARADLLAIDGRAPYNPAVDSIFNRRTNEMPRRRVHLSPRLGFTWDVSGAGRDYVRGGVGIFTGRPPLNWAHSALHSYGVGVGVLRCGRLPKDLGPPPPFVPDYRAAPTTCANGAGLETAPTGDVDLLDRRLRMAQTFRASLAYDRRLPWDILATAEALITRNVSDFVFVNLNLKGPQAIDRHGRVLYGTINSNGQATPAPRADFSEVIDLRNTSKNHSHQLSARVEKRFSDGMAATASYTYSRVRDVQTPLRAVRGTVNWAGARAVSGRHEDFSLATSLYEVPHRVVLGGTYTAPWQRWSTTLSFYYLGESGSPFTYRARGVGGRGDLNADGSNANDPIYVPRSAADTSEIAFDGSPDQILQQQAAFEALIERTPCLRRQRGRIVARNSCREPPSHVTIASVRQAIPIAGRALVLELDVFNVLNLLKSEWGHYRVAAPALLEHVGQTSADAATAQPIFRFDTSAPQWTTLETESAFQLQVALRYSF